MPSRRTSRRRSASTAPSAGPSRRQAAQRGPDRRGRRSCTTRERAFDDREKHHPQEPGAGRLGPVRGRDRDHRPHLAHDVAAHRPPAPDVRRGARREVRRRHREGLSTRRRLRGPAAARRCRRTPSSWSCRTTASTRSGAGEPQHLAHPERLHDRSRVRATEKSLAGPLRPRQVLRGRRLVADQGLRGRPRPDLLQPRGRETQGIVSAGAEYAAAGGDPGEAAALKDPDRTSRSSGTIYKRDDIYKGEYLHYAPDLQVGFNEGYRVGWQDTMGGDPARTLVENNNRKWKRRPLRHRDRDQRRHPLPEPPHRAAEPHIMDLAPTILKILEADPERPRRQAPLVGAVLVLVALAAARRGRPRRPRPGRRRPTRSGCVRSRSGGPRWSGSSPAYEARRGACSARWSSWRWRCGCARCSCARCS